ncbi:MAG: glycosyltransferase, partial [Elusimicrobiota bacterium]|nr:glycosyltransferase [Elusimicrobiota bacterium]
MKVFHIDSERSFRGGQRQILYLLEGLEKRGVENFLFCPGKSPLFERAEKNRKISVAMFGEFDIFSAYKIAKFINREKPAILHCHSAHALSVVIIARKLASHKPALIASRRVIFPIRCRKKYISADKIIAISGAVKISLEESGVPSSRTAIVYSGIKKRPVLPDESVTAKKRLGIESGVLTVAVVGALTKEKGHKIIIGAFGEILRRGLKLKLVIAGSGGLDKELRQYAADRGVADSVLFTGFRKDILQLLPAFDIVVNASESEGLG